MGITTHILNSSIHTHTHTHTHMFIVLIMKNVRQVNKSQLRVSCLRSSGEFVIHTSHLIIEIVKLIVVCYYPTLHFLTIDNIM